MFNNRKKEIERIDWIFNTFLLKLQKYPGHIKEDEIIRLYVRATKVAKTIGNLEYLYMQNGEIDNNIIEGEEVYE